MDPIDDAALMAQAEAARSFAHAPYSRFRVGAALLADGGAVIQGCNVENASYGATICAERTAVVAAVAAGHRRFTAIAIAGPAGIALGPCGLCRQVLSEFAPGGSLRVLTRDAAGAIHATTIGQLLPAAFSATDLASSTRD